MISSPMQIDSLSPRVKINMWSSFPWDAARRRQVCDTLYGRGPTVILWLGVDHISGWVPEPSSLSDLARAGRTIRP